MTDVRELTAKTVNGPPCTHLREAFEEGRTMGIVDQRIWKRCPVCGVDVVFEPMSEPHEA